MIERILYQLLKSSPRIVAEVADNIFPSRAVGGTKGPKIVLQKDGGAREYHLRNEADCMNALVDCRCYHRTSSEAHYLFDLVRDRISGMRSETVTWFDARGNMHQSNVQEITIPDDVAEDIIPPDGSDGDSAFFHSVAASLNVWVSQAVPTHT